MIVCVGLCIPLAALADGVKGVYLETTQTINGVMGNYNLPSPHPMTPVSGNVYKLQVTSCATSTFSFRIGVDGWGDTQIAPSENDDEFMIDDENASNETTPTAHAKDWMHAPSSNKAWKVNWSNSAGFLTIYVDISEAKKIWVVEPSDGISYTDTQFEMVAECGGKSLVLPLSQTRNRKEATNPENDAMSTTYFTVGFKDESLPGGKNDQVRVYVRGKNNNYAQFRPATDGSNLGDAYALLGNTSLKDLRNAPYITGATAVNSGNAFLIQKGSGVSYTVGLNIGQELTESPADGTAAHPVSYTIKANSLTLYTNKSLDEYFGDLYADYKNRSGVTKKENLEDYYIFGTIYGTKGDDSEKGDYMCSGDTRWNTTDAKGKLISSYFKMEKHIYLNPNDKNQVDSIVYSKVIARPTNETYSNMYMTFAPKSLVDDGTRSFNYTGNGQTYSDMEKWNLVIRPEVFDEQDGTAIKGAVLVSGATYGQKRNGEQSLNPEVQNDKEYYIIRLNTTTSTYRVEFINHTNLTVTNSGIRTFCSRFNHKIPEGCYAYAAHKFVKADDEERSTRLPAGAVKLRSLKFIPANEPVVLVYKDYFVNPSTENPTKTISLEVITDGNDTEGYLDLPTQEEWWTNYEKYKDTNDNDYNNLLVAVLDGEKIENGKYHETENHKFHYDYRHFSLTYYHNTKYGKEHPEVEDYIGFFRAAGYVPAGYAYLRLTDKDMNFNGQLLDKVESNVDVDPTGDAIAPAKMSFAFDVEPNDEVTGIREVKNMTVTDDAYYTLQGIKVEHPTKGIYIHHAKKMMIK